jgi:phage replication O-like protein O
MSAALYNDAAASAYGNTPLPAENCADLGIIDGNHLNLLPEHALVIYIRCLDHLAMCQLSSRCVRVFFAILNQTIGFKKLEDNINTTRLEKLTKIRHDHAGQAMKDLVAMNILMHRTGGTYRNWLSVNFNLATWGNSNSKDSDKTNNPIVLLPRKYTEEPIDQGLQLSMIGQDYLKLPAFQSSASSNQNTDSTTLAAENTHNTTAENAQNSHSEIGIPPAIQTKNPAKTSVKETANSDNTKIKSVPKSDIETISQSQNSATTQTTLADNLSQIEYSVTQTVANLVQDKMTQFIDLIDDKLQCFEQQLHSKKSDNSPSKAPQNKPSSDTTSANQASDKPQQANQSAKQKQKNKRNLKQPHEAASVNAPELANAKPLELPKLRYPTQLNQQQCEELHKSLYRSGDQAQNLLNLLALRLENIHAPIKNTSAYFAALVGKLRKDDLDLSAAQHYQIKDPKQIENKKLRQELQFDYRNHQSDYQHFEKVVQAEMRKTGQDFTEACKTLHMTIIFDDINKKLQTTKQALDGLIE